MGSTSTSLSFSFAAPSGSDSFCFDYHTICLELGALNDATYTDAQVTGNAFTFAFSYESLWLDATCAAYAEAYARTCSFMKVDGKVDVHTSVQNTKKDVSMNVVLKTATMTLAIAESVAIAQSYADVGAYSYTTVDAYCSKINNLSIICPGGTASTDLSQLAVASAGSIGQAGAVAASGTTTQSAAAVMAEGSSLTYINSVISAFAESWSFAAAGAAASAIADAFTAVCNESFSSMCVAEHGRICSIAENSGRGICNDQPDVACATAYAKGEAWSEALSLACAQEFASAQTKTSAFAAISANVNCQGTPVFTWTCADGFSSTTCSSN
jgi:hypothetical protein